MQKCIQFESNTDIEHMIEKASNAKEFCGKEIPFRKYRSISKTEEKYDKQAHLYYQRKLERENEKLTRIAADRSFWGLECVQFLT